VQFLAACPPEHCDADAAPLFDYRGCAARAAQMVDALAAFVLCDGVRRGRNCISAVRSLCVGGREAGRWPGSHSTARGSGGAGRGGG
jgi:hypothetical protein